MALTESMKALYAAQDQAIATAREILAEVRRQAAEQEPGRDSPSSDREPSAPTRADGPEHS